MDGNKQTYSLLKDINGDTCPKILMGIIVGIVWIALSIIAFFYALSHEIACAAIIDSVLIGLAAYSAALLGITVLQKIRGQ